MSLHVGEAIGDYRIIGIIGAGGMGQVFQVEHKITQRKEAMKVLIADLADDTQVQRFKREIEVQARLNHPNIAAVHNAFRLKDRLVLVLEFVEGQTLESLLKKGRPRLETGIDYIRQTLEALSYAHNEGVIHRDVSPANLMVTESELVKLMDFGVAKSLGDLRLTDGGSMVGSLYYMSPEQVKGCTDPDPRSDIYSVGAILYEVVTGKKPFDYEDRFSLMVAQVEEQPRLPSLIDPGLPIEMDDIILKALAKEPASRYGSAKEFLSALAVFKQTQAASAPARTPDQKRQVVFETVAGVSVLVICAMAGVGAVAWNRVNEPFPPPPAVLAIPRAPEDLAAVPPAQPVVARTPLPEPASVESTPVQPKLRPAHSTSAQPASAQPSVVRLKPAPKVLAKPSPEASPLKTDEATEEVTPLEAKPAEVKQADDAQLAEPQQAEARPSAKPEGEAQPAEPKKAGFWSKLNPFHRKKKADSALSSPSNASPVNHSQQ